MNDSAAHCAEPAEDPKNIRVKRRGNRASRVPEIIRVSTSVLAEWGASGYSINRVAAEAGIRLSTLQHYFGTREQLLQATIRDIYSRYVDSYVQLCSDDTKSPEKRLDAVADLIFDDLLVGNSDVSAFVLECWALAEREPRIREMVEEGSKQFQKIWCGLIAEMNPNLSHAECVVRATLIETHAEGLMVFCKRSRPTGRDLNALRRATKATWQGLGRASG